MHSFILSNFPEEIALTKILQLTDLSILADTIDKQTDVFWIKPEVNTKTTTQKASIKIETIRSLQTNLTRTPLNLPFNLVIVSQAQTMTIPSQNAFLKILEEPTTQTQFFLITPNHQLLLPTIQSRCQLIINSPNQIQPDNQTQLLEEFVQIDKASIPERLVLADQHNQGRNEALEWLKQLVLVLEEKMIQESNPKKRQKLAQILTNMQITHQDIDRNLNIKLSLDNLMINWDKA